ncbi:hypothetical protein [Streptomyces sp. L7]|uniref:hypothetical protein n=1 Tax=Streptomyces sp. L7 TaxID=3423954 RepID=UPI003D992C16
MPVQVALGALVLAAGVLLLLESLGVIITPVLWALVLVCAGVTFGLVFFAERRSWWAAIPSAALIGAAIVTLMDLDPRGLGQWTEVPMLGVLGLGFWAIYLRDRRHWWALIPGGILLTLSIVTALAGTVGGAGTGVAFLLGAALTFVLVAVLPGGASPRWWAWIPAGVLALAAVVVLASAAEWFALVNVLWPIAVIGAGAFLIGRALRRRRRPEDGVDAGPDAASSGRADRS